jgi:hypothetical protein
MLIPSSAKMPVIFSILPGLFSEKTETCITLSMAASLATPTFSLSLKE